MWSISQPTNSLFSVLTLVYAHNNYMIVILSFALNRSNNFITPPSEIQAIEETYYYTAAAMVSTFSFTPQKVHLVLLHQMVLEDSIAAQFSSFTLNCSLLNGPRNIFTSSYKWVMYKQNCRWINSIPPGIIVPIDHLQCNVSFFSRRTWGLLLLLQICQSAAALTSMCLPLHTKKKRSMTL